MTQAAASPPLKSNTRVTCVDVVIVHAPGLPASVAPSIFRDKNTRRIGNSQSNRQVAGRNGRRTSSAAGCHGSSLPCTASASAFSSSSSAAAAAASAAANAALSSSSCHLPHSARPTTERRRQIGVDKLQRSGVQRLLKMLRSNSEADTSMRVLRLKQYLDADANPMVIDTVLDALESNTMVEALYIQNFERGMLDPQLVSAGRPAQRLLGGGETAARTHARTHARTGMGRERSGRAPCGPRLPLRPS
eukprot:COSAG01_NODE_7554_length_3152_cov_1.079266_2_plen_248_part_00